ncbi:E3 ubiquitin-protein ligase RNF152-like [Paramormyrops kingsleyae]|uniref:E3 ubiquitin-protein ligase RNF152-like n=1 Tax=Paramormyrops kingsleyae TaxID=1676925 RepID=UPI003B97A0F0
MEPLQQDSISECQICFNRYSPRRRPKLLDCRHTCCSACLTHMRSGQRELRCPWCRAVTRLPAGLPVSCLPDDPSAIAAAAFPRVPERGAIFASLPGPPLGGTDEPPMPLGTRQKGMATVAMPETEGGVAERRSAARKGPACPGVCTVLLVACVLLFLLGIVLHNMSCISKRLTLVPCG